MDQDPTRKVLAELQRRFRIAGRGSITRVERELGLGPGFFKDQRRPQRRRVDLKILLQALDALSVDPAEFFATVLGSADPEAGFFTEAAALRRRMKKPPAVLAAIDSRKPSPAGPRAAGQAAELDRLRYKNPRRAMRRIRSLVTEAAASQLPRLLGVYASACRVASKLDEAQVVIAHALALATERGDLAARADLLLRAGYVAGSRGQYEIAHALAESATLVSVQLGDPVEIGRALVDQGIWLGQLDRPRSARRAFRSALGFLPDEREAGDQAVWKNRVSCLMSLGVVHRRLGELETARTYAARARAQSSILDTTQLGSLMMLQAAIARDLGELSQAEELYREALSAFEAVSPLDAAICGVDLVHVHLLQGKAACAYAAARSLTPLVMPLESNPLAAAALTELLRCALAGRGLSAGLLGRLHRELRSGRAREAPARRI